MNKPEIAVCPSCRSQNPAGAKFCNQCGARLDAAPAPARPSYTPKHLADKVLKARSALVGERKRVTVLFADIKGSTKLAEQAGAEAWHGILDRFFSILSEAVHRYEGTVNQYTGDGIMALFGAPVAHEDHAQRACFAALAMQAELRRFADELRLKQGLNLSLRVGLNTGEVIVGRIGDDLRMDYTAQGLTVNLAARMEHICEPGHVYLTRDTAALVEGYFQLRDLGDMAVQGSSAPVRVYDLEGQGALRTRLERQMVRIGSRFIGREKEMAALHEAIEQARGGKGRVTAVVGNAGIGKSRLCHEFLEACVRSGVPVHRATGVPYATALPLYPVQQLLRSRLNVSEHCPDEEARRLVAGTFLLQDAANAAILPSILEFLGVSSSQGRAPDQAAEAREKMFALLARWMPRADRPQVLLVEDLHFADPGTEEFLARLCHEIHDTSTLLLLNYRPDYISERLLPLIDEQIQVTALTSAQIADLARLALGSDPSLEGVAERIAERASGNPYYAEEAVQALVDEARVEGERGAYKLVKPIDTWRIPDTVHALISARIDRLAEEQKVLLQNASVIGQEFASPVLANLAALEPEPFESSLTVLEEGGFVHQHDAKPVVRYRFCHPLVQEVAYQTQLESQRALAHGRLAGALEKEHPLSAPPDEMAAQIAHHWQAAGEWAKAGAWNMQASRWFAARDLGSVGVHFRRAIENFDRAPDAPDVIKGRVMARAGLVRMSQFVDVPQEDLDRAFQEAKRMAEAARDVPLIAELHLSYANEQLHRGDAESAAELVHGAVAQAVKAGVGPEIVHRFRLAILLAANNAGYIREGIDLVNGVVGPGWMTEPVTAENYMSRGFFGFMQAALGRLEAGEADLLRACQFAEKDGRNISWMHAFLVDIGNFRGGYDRVMAEARLAVQSAEKAGSPFFRAIAMRAMGLAHCLLGTPREAIPLLEEHRVLVQPGGLAHQIEANYLAVLSRAYREAGRIEAAADAAQAAVAAAQRAHARVWEISAWVSYLELPRGGPWEKRFDEGERRVGELLEATRADAFRPFCLLAREKLARDAKAAQSLRQQALSALKSIGADGHLKRLTSSA